MIPFKATRRVQIDDPQPQPVSEAPRYDDVEDDREDEFDGGMRLRPSEGNVTEDQEPFMGVKVRRKTSLHREYQGDYIDVPSHPFLLKILQKQGYISIYSYSSFRLMFNRFGLVLVQNCLGLGFIFAWRSFNRGFIFDSVLGNQKFLLNLYLLLLSFLGFRPLNLAFWCFQMVRLRILAFCFLCLSSLKVGVNGYFFEACICIKWCQDDPWILILKLLTDRACVFSFAGSECVCA